MEEVRNARVVVCRAAAHDGDVAAARVRAEGVVHVGVDVPAAHGAQEASAREALPPEAEDGGDGATVVQDRLEVRGGARDARREVIDVRADPARAVAPAHRRDDL